VIVQALAGNCFIGGPQADLAGPGHVVDSVAAGVFGGGVAARAAAENKADHGAKLIGLGAAVELVGERMEQDESQVKGGSDQAPAEGEATGELHQGEGVHVGEGVHAERALKKGRKAGRVW
jgi:hypothetical protein